MTEKQLIRMYERDAEIITEKYGENQDRVRIDKLTIDFLKEHMRYRSIGTVEAFQRAMEFQSKQLKICGWIPCSERLPESEKDVEITYVRKHWNTGEPLYFTARAFYEDGTMTTEASSFNWDATDNWEYNEEKDYYVIPDGWFESVSFAEEFEAVDVPVIAWREITEPYKPAKEETAE